MTIDATAPRTRRAVLAGALGGLAAVAANALGRPMPTLAADGQAMLVGGEYSSSSVTSVTNATGNGIYGGSLGTGIAVTGQSNQGIGVHGFSTSSIGALGETSSSVEAAVAGRSFGGGTGVLGSADNAPIPAAVSIATRNDGWWKPHWLWRCRAAITTLPTPMTIAIAIVDPRHGKATRAPRDRRSLSARSTTLSCPKMTAPIAALAARACVAVVSAARTTMSSNFSSPSTGAI